MLDIHRLRRSHASVPLVSVADLSCSAWAAYNPQTMGKPVHHPAAAFLRRQPRLKRGRISVGRSETTTTRNSGYYEY